MTAPYLVDTNIISELARKTPDTRVLNFMTSTANILVSSLLFHELTFGLAITNPEQARKLLLFVTAMRERFGARAIAVDVPIAETAGIFRASEKQQGRVLTVSDALIAATASVHGAVLVTRNIKDFRTLGVPVLNPFSG